MHWIYAVTGAGIYAWVSFCFAEDVAMCKRGTASGPNITLLIEMTSLTNRCCCHLDFHTFGPVWRKMTVDCGIMVDQNVSSLFDKDCHGRNDSFTMIIHQNETDLCVFRKDTHTQSHLPQGQLMMMQRLDIDVNCSEPVLVGPSTSSTQGVTPVLEYDIAEVAFTINGGELFFATAFSFSRARNCHLECNGIYGVVSIKCPELNVSVPVPTGPSNSSTKGNKELLWIIISCVNGVVALITIAICGLCICRRRRQKSQSSQGKADTGPLEDGYELVIVDNVLNSSGGFVNAKQRNTRQE